VVSGFAVESLVIGLSALPAVLFWEWHFRWSLPANWIRIVLLSMSLLPAYLLFALVLMILSAGSTRLLRWRTPPDVVRVLAGTWLRATPLWSLYHRLNGARVGHRVYLNSVTLSDHNLLAFGDDVVVGAGVHLSGHVVEDGMLKTGTVRLGRGVTIGVGTMIEIDVVIGDATQVGALSVVPKHRTLQPHAIYGGVPARRLDRPG
jgi:acetyltransferase-like isoleucine patch superfamily enzyme